MPGKMDTIGIKHGTDKSSNGHGYLDIYERYFASRSGECITFMEIGVFKGSSLKTWEECFPKAKILAIDIKDMTRFDTARSKTFIVDQSDRNQLEDFASKNGPFDIVIDDGSHIVEHQQVSLGCLFPFVRTGGIYVVEDLHTSRERKQRFREKYNPTGTANTTLAICHQMAKGERVVSDFMVQSEIEYLHDNVEFCVVEMARKSEICFIFKKQ